jgi:hypothetical protein
MTDHHDRGRRATPLRSRYDSTTFASNMTLKQRHYTGSYCNYTICVAFVDSHDRLRDIGCSYVLPISDWISKGVGGGGGSISYEETFAALFMLQSLQRRRERFLTQKCMV